MQVYHGSYTAIDVVDLGKCQANKDFGRGFYVTKFRHHAVNWAKIIGKKHHAADMVTEFEFYERAFDEERFKSLRFNMYNEAWLDFVVMNRDTSTMVQRHNYDIVEGPVADDKITNRINDYLANEITKEEFLQELIWHEDTHQICFCTPKSLQMLVRSDRRRWVSKFAHINEPLIEQLMLDFDCDAEKAADLFFSSATFTQLAHTASKLYERPWQEIYRMLKAEITQRGQ